MADLITQSGSNRSQWELSQPFKGVIGDNRLIYVLDPRTKIELKYTLLVSMQPSLDYFNQDLAKKSVF